MSKEKKHTCPKRWQPVFHFPSPISCSGKTFLHFWLNKSIYTFWTFFYI